MRGPKILQFLNFEKRIVISIKKGIERATPDMRPLKSTKKRTTLMPTITSRAAALEWNVDLNHIVENRPEFC